MAEGLIASRDIVGTTPAIGSAMWHTRGRDLTDRWLHFERPLADVIGSGEPAMWPALGL